MSSRILQDQINVENAECFAFICARILHPQGASQPLVPEIGGIFKITMRSTRRAQRLGRKPLKYCCITLAGPAWSYRNPLYRNPLYVEYDAVHHTNENCRCGLFYKTQIADTCSSHCILSPSIYTEFSRKKRREVGEAEIRCMEHVLSLHKGVSPTMLVCS